MVKVDKIFKGYLINTEKLEDGKFTFVARKRNQYGIDRIYWSDQKYETSKKARAEATRFVTRLICGAVRNRGAA